MLCVAVGSLPVAEPVLDKTTCRPICVQPWAVMLVIPRVPVSVPWR